MFYAWSETMLGTRLTRCLNIANATGSSYPFGEKDEEEGETRRERAGGRMHEWHRATTIQLGQIFESRVLRSPSLHLHVYSYLPPRRHALNYRICDIIA